MSETTEKEAIERLVDAARSAADRVLEMVQAFAVGGVVLPLTLIRLRRHLTDAKGSAHQLGHQQQNPHYFTLRNQLEEIERSVTQVAMSRSPQAGLILARLGFALDCLWREAEKMSRSKPMARQEVLAALDLRQKAIASNG